MAYNTELKIEKGLPLPNNKRQVKYPFPEMGVGDSFVIPKTERHRVQNAAIFYARGTGKKFSIRAISDTECRCWRIADPVSS